MVVAAWGSGECSLQLQASHRRLQPPSSLRRSHRPTSSSQEGFTGLSKRTTSRGLREAFSKFGQVIHAKGATDLISGYTKGFGFVRYATLEEAAQGIKGLDGQFLDGWVIFAEYARLRPPPSPPQDSGPQSSGYPSSGYAPSSY